MRLPAILALSFLAVSLLTACEIVPQEKPIVIVAERISGPEADVAAIEQAADRLLAAAKRGDVDAMMEEFSDDSVIIPPGLPVMRGKEAIRVFYRTQFAEFELQDIGPSQDELVVCGDWAFSRGTVAIVGNYKGHDESVKVFNRGLEIWKKHSDGSWKIARAIGNR